MGTGTGTFGEPIGGKREMTETIQLREVPECPNHSMKKTGVVDGTATEIRVCESCGHTRPAGQSWMLERSGKYDFKDAE